MTDAELRALGDLARTGSYHPIHRDHLAWLVRRARRASQLERALEDAAALLDRAKRARFCPGGSVCLGCDNCEPTSEETGG